MTCNEGRLDVFCSTSEEYRESVTTLEEDESTVMSSFSVAVEICVTSSLLVATDPGKSSRDKS